MWVYLLWTGNVHSFLPSVSLFFVFFLSFFLSLGTVVVHIFYNDFKAFVSYSLACFAASPQKLYDTEGNYDDDDGSRRKKKGGIMMRR